MRLLLAFGEIDTGLVRALAQAAHLTFHGGDLILRIGRLVHQIGKVAFDRCVILGRGERCALERHAGGDSEGQQGSGRPGDVGRRSRTAEWTKVHVGYSCKL